MSEYTATLGEPDDLQLRIGKLEKINNVLMNRVEKSMDFSGGGFSLFQTAMVLESQVKARTHDLEATLNDLSDAYNELQRMSEEAKVARQNLTSAIEAVSEGFALFDEHECLVLCNAPFRELMPDVKSKLVPGVSFEKVARLFSSSRYINLEDGVSPSEWAAFRLSKFRSPYASFVQRFAGDRWIQVSNRRADVGSTVIFQTDISDLVRLERERRERQLDEQSQLLQATIDHLPQGISMFSASGRLRAWNSRFPILLNISIKNVRRQASFEKIWEEACRNGLAASAQASRKVSEWASRSGRAQFESIEVKRKDGVVLWISCRPIADGGFVMSFDDITAQRMANRIMQEANELLEKRVAEKTEELVEANKQLSLEVSERRAIAEQLVIAKETAEEANQSKTRFLAAAGHDLLQPLDAARILLSLLMDTGLNERQRHLFEKTSNAFASIESLLETLLDISYYDSVALTPKLVSFPLGELLEDFCNECHPVAEKNGLELRYVPVHVNVESDPQLLRRVVQNYVSNAIRYTKSGKILVGARRRGKKIEIQVIDTGPGIASDQLEQIFLEFRRLPSDQANIQKEVKAMGLGLSIVSRIARLLEYDIEVRSIVGRGSCFSVLVPTAG